MHPRWNIVNRSKGNFKFSTYTYKRLIKLKIIHYLGNAILSSDHINKFVSIFYYKKMYILNIIIIFSFSCLINRLKMCRYLPTENINVMMYGRSQIVVSVRIHCREIGNIWKKTSITGSLCRRIWRNLFPYRVMTSSFAIPRNLIPPPSRNAYTYIYSNNIIYKNYIIKTTANT